MKHILSAFQCVFVYTINFTYTFLLATACLIAHTELLQAQVTEEWASRYNNTLANGEE